MRFFERRKPPEPVAIQPASRAPTQGTIIPRDLGALGTATSDSGYLVLQAIAYSQGLGVAADIAAGYADAFARFALAHPDAFDEEIQHDA